MRVSLVGYSIIRVASMYSAHGARNANINRGEPSDVFGLASLPNGLPRRAAILFVSTHTEGLRYANVRLASLDLSARDAVGADA